MTEILVFRKLGACSYLLPRAGILQSPNPCFQRHGRAKHVHQLSCALVLHWAIRARDSELVELMIHQKAPLNPAGEEGEALSALGVAVVSRDETIIPRLLNAGARPGQNEEPCPIARAIETDQPRVVKLPLEHGIRLNSDTGLCVIARRNDKILL